jgi:hypothetical protein
MRQSFLVLALLTSLCAGCHSAPEEARLLFYHNEDGKLRMQWPTFGKGRMTIGEVPEPGKRDERVTLDFDEGTIKRGDPDSFLPPMEY